MPTLLLYPIDDPTSLLPEEVEAVFSQSGVQLREYKGPSEAGAPAPTACQLGWADILGWHAMGPGEDPEEMEVLVLSATLNDAPQPRTFVFQCDDSRAAAALFAQHSPTSPTSPTGTIGTSGTTGAVSPTNFGSPAVPTAPLAVDAQASAPAAAAEPARYTPTPSPTAVATAQPQPLLPPSSFQLCRQQYPTTELPASAPGSCCFRCAPVRQPAAARNARRGSVIAGAGTDAFSQLMKALGRTDVSMPSYVGLLVQCGHDVHVLDFDGGAGQSQAGEAGQRGKGTGVSIDGTWRPLVHSIAWAAIHDCCATVSAPAPALPDVGAQELFSLTAVLPHTAASTRSEHDVDSATFLFACADDDMAEMEAAFKRARNMVRRKSEAKTQLRFELEQARLFALFEACDLNGDGSISRDEFNLIFNVLGHAQGQPGSSQSESAASPNASVRTPKPSTRTAHPPGERHTTWTAAAAAPAAAVTRTPPPRAT